MGVYDKSLTQVVSYSAFFPLCMISWAFSMLLKAPYKHIIILSFNISLFRQFVQASPFLYCWMLVLVPIFAVKIYVAVHILLYVNFGSHLWISPEGKVFHVQWMHGSQCFFKKLLMWLPNGSGGRWHWESPLVSVLKTQCSMCWKAFVQVPFGSVLELFF